MPVRSEPSGQELQEGGNEASDLGLTAHGERLENPFPGLRPYGAGESFLFFGREAHVESVLQKLTSQRFSAVVGSSGTGKSSLVFAGVLPRLARGYRTTLLASAAAPRRSAWRVAQLRPGDDPMRRLALALMQAAHDEESVQPPSEREHALALSMLEARLARSQAGLVEACASLRLGNNENLLLVIDQFEELFRYRKLSRAQNPLTDSALAFVQRLLHACTQKALPIHVLLTMRAEFLGECVQMKGLAEAINAGQFLLPSLDRDQRKLVIRGPMAVAGARIAPSLVQRLLNDAGDGGDQLPLLQHALMRSFQAWQGAVPPSAELALAHYEAAGGLAHALARHADEAFSEVTRTLGSEGARIVERVFRALADPATPGEGDGPERYVRRPCRVAELLAIADVELPVLKRVLACFTTRERGFLTVEPRDQALTPDAIIDLAHEALIRVWERLHGWLERERAFAAQVGYLRDALDKQRAGIAGLWRDPELSMALRWRDSERPTAAALRRYGVELAQMETFLAESQRAQYEAREAERDAKTLRRFRAMVSRARRHSLFAALLVFVSLLAQGSGMFDALWPWSTRLKLWSASVHTLRAERVLDERVVPVLIDARTVASLRDRVERGEAFGELSGKWRALQAQALAQLSAAGAKVVMFDVQFENFRDRMGQLRSPSPLEREGTGALAEAIARARAAGTGVVIAAGTTRGHGQLDTHPTIAAVLADEGRDTALGLVASPCIARSEERGALLFAPLLTTHAGRAPRPGLALAALAAYRRLPNFVLSAPSRNLFLAGRGEQKSVPFSVLGRAVTGPEGCETFEPGDRPVHQIVDVSAQPMTRAHPAVIPFEQAVAGVSLSKLKGKIAFVGADLGAANGTDQHRVLSCDRSPWSCRFAWRSGFDLHLDALNAVLRGRAARPIGPAGQLIVMLCLALAAAWLRLKNHGQPAWKRWGTLALLIGFDLVLVALAALTVEYLMDEAYHILAMVGTHVLAGWLDRSDSARRRALPANAWLMMLTWSVCALGVQGCATAHPECPPLAAVETLVSQGGEREAAHIEVRRRGVIVHSYEHMFLERGDTLTTGGKTSALISFAGGRIVLKPRTSITIGVPPPAPPSPAAVSTARAPTAARSWVETAGRLSGSAHYAANAKEEETPPASNVAMSKPADTASSESRRDGPEDDPEEWSLPWIFASFGELLGIGKVGVKTTSATGAVRGTKYHVKVDRESGASTFTVLEGKVVVQPTASTWSVQLRVGQRVAVPTAPSLPPEPVTISSAESNELLAELESLGAHRHVELPLLVGLEANVALARLLQLGIADARTEFVAYARGADKAAQVGTVLKQDPAVGQRAGYVTLTIAGVPDLTGLRKTEAARVLADVGLNIQPTTTNSAQDANELIVAQTPEAGASAKPGSYVTLVTTGAEASSRLASGTGSRQDMPDVTGVNLQRAIDTLQAAGLSADVTMIRRNELKATRVIGQTPLPGAQVATSARVSLLAAVPSNTPNVPHAESATLGRVPAFELLDEALSFSEQAAWDKARDKLEKARDKAEYPNVVFQLALAHAHLTDRSAARSELARFKQIAGAHNPHLAEVENLERLAAEPLVRPTTPVSREPTRMPLGPVLTMAGGAAVLVAAGVVYRFAQVAFDELERNCAPRQEDEKLRRCSDSDLVDVRKRGEILTPAAQGLFGIGAAAVLAGAAWWLFLPREDRLRFSAMCNGRACAASATLRF